MAQELERINDQTGGFVRIQFGCERLFAELLSHNVRCHGRVKISRRQGAEFPLEIDLAGRGVKQVGATYNVSYPLIAVIDNYRKLVSE